MVVIRTLAGMLRYGGFVSPMAMLTAPMKRFAIRKILQQTLFAGIPLPSGRTAQGIFRRYGLGIRTSDFNSTYTQTKNIYDKIKAAGKIGLSGVVPDDLIGELSRDWGKKYTYTFGNTYTDPITGEQKTSYYSTTSSHKMTTEHITEVMRERMGYSDRYRMFSPDDYELLYVAKRSGS